MSGALGTCASPLGSAAGSPGTSIDYVARQALAAQRSQDAHRGPALSAREVRRGWDAYSLDAGAVREVVRALGPGALPGRAISLEGRTGAGIRTLAGLGERQGPLRGERVAAAKDVPLEVRDIEEPDGTEVDGDPPWWRRLPQPETRPIDAIPFGRGPWRDTPLVETVPFVIPLSSTWGSDCSFSGFETECSARLPNVNRQEGVPDLTDRSAADQISLHGCDDVFSDLFQAAWTFLVNNRDIVEWVTCLVFGASDSEAVVNRLTTDLDKVDVNCSDGKTFAPGVTVGGAINPCNEDNLALAFPLFGINWCTVKTSAEAWGVLWEDGTPEERLCALIDCSCLMAHEVCHLALTWEARDLNGTSCDTRRSYLMQNTLRWALLQRFPAALEAECCHQFAESGLVDPLLFMEDENRKIPQSCRPA